MTRRPIRANLRRIGRRPARGSPLTAAALACAAVLALLSACATAPTGAANQLPVLFPAERPFPESRFSSFGGIQLHYRVWEPETEPRGKILLLPTVGGSTATFRFVAPALAQEGFTVAAVDLPGFGFSDRSLSFAHTVEARADLLWTLADRLDTEENRFSPTDAWILLGHGEGGGVAAAMALARASRTNRLILIASPLGTPRTIGRGSSFPPVRWALRGWLRNSLYTMDGIEELLGKAYGRPPSPDEVALYAAPLLRSRMVDAYMNYFRTAGRIAPELEEISAPTLVIWGGEDAWEPLQRATPLVERLPGAVLQTIPEAGHIPVETHPSQALELLLAWLAGG